MNLDVETYPTASGHCKLCSGWRLHTMQGSYAMTSSVNEACLMKQ